MNNKTLHLGLTLPFVAFCVTELFFQSIFCVAVVASVPLALAALNHRRLLGKQRQYANAHPCESADLLLHALKERFGLPVPARSFITDLHGPFYCESLDAIAVTSRWLKTLDRDPDAAAAVVVHELSHRQELSTTPRLLVTLTLGTWPVLFVIAAFYNVASLNPGTNTTMSLLHLLAAFCVPSLAYGLGYVARRSLERTLELRADALAATFGYAAALIRLLSDPPGERPAFSALRQLTNSHPSASKRVRALEVRSRPSPVSGTARSLGTI